MSEAEDVNGSLGCWRSRGDVLSGGLLNTFAPKRPLPGVVDPFDCPSESLKTCMGVREGFSDCDLSAWGVKTLEKTERGRGSGRDGFSTSTGVITTFSGESCSAGEVSAAISFEESALRSPPPARGAGVEAFSSTKGLN